MSGQAQAQSQFLSQFERSSSYGSTGPIALGSDPIQPTSMLMPMSVDSVGDGNNRPQAMGATEVEEVHVRQVQFDGDIAANTSLWHTMLRSPPPPPRALWSDDEEEEEEGDDDNGDGDHGDDNVAGANTSATRHYPSVSDTGIGIGFDTAAFNRQHTQSYNGNMHEFVRPLTQVSSSSDHQQNQEQEQDSPASSRTMDDYQDEDDEVYWNATQGMMQRKPTPHPNDMRRTLARRLEAIKLQTRQPHRVIPTAVRSETAHKAENE